MKTTQIECRSCGCGNHLPAFSDLTVFRCESCRQLNKLNLTQRLALMRGAEHRFPIPTFLRDGRANARR